MEKTTEFQINATNCQVARSIIIEHLRLSDLPVMSVRQAYNLVSKQTENLYRQVERNGKLTMEKRKYRRDIFINNFHSKHFIVSPMSDGSNVIFLRETSHVPANRKLIELFTHRRQADFSLSSIPQSARG